MTQEGPVVVSRGAGDSQVCTCAQHAALEPQLASTYGLIGMYDWEEFVSGVKHESV